MSKRPRSSARIKTHQGPTLSRTCAPWPVVLVAMAAAGRADGGVGLQHLLEDAGFHQKPAMTIIVKKPRPRMDRGTILDPCVDDVLDALRALCVSECAA